MTEMPRLDDAEIRSFRPDSRGQVRRLIEARWPIDGQPIGHDGHYVVLSTSHDKERRQFRASLRIEELTDSGRITRHHISMSDASYLRLATQPVARYSAKSLSTFFDSLFTVEQLTDPMRRCLTAHELQAA